MQPPCKWELPPWPPQRPSLQEGDRPRCGLGVLQRPRKTDSSSSSSGSSGTSSSSSYGARSCRSSLQREAKSLSSSTGAIVATVPTEDISRISLRTPRRWRDDSSDSSGRGSENGTFAAESNSDSQEVGAHNLFRSYDDANESNSDNVSHQAESGAAHLARGFRIAEGIGLPDVNLQRVDGRAQRQRAPDVPASHRGDCRVLQNINAPDRSDFSCAEAWQAKSDSTILISAPGTPGRRRQAGSLSPRNVHTVLEVSETIRECTEKESEVSTDASNTRRGGPERRQQSKKFSCCRDFPWCVAHCPILFAIFFFMFLTAVLMLMWPGIEVETDFSVFLETDSEANDYYDTLRTAMEASGNPRLAPGSRNLRAVAAHENVLHKILTLSLMYHARTTDGFGNYTKLFMIHQFERDLREGRRWKHICEVLSNDYYRHYCDPGRSFVNVVWPTQVPSDMGVLWNFDGKGDEPVPLAASRRLAELLPLAKQVLPTSLQVNEKTKSKADQPLNIIRSAWEFNVICCDTATLPSERNDIHDEIDKEYGEFVDKELMPKLERAKKEFAEDDIDIMWQGSTVSNLEIMQTLKRDALLACGSALALIMILSVATKSFTFACIGVLLPMGSIPVGFIIAARIGGSNRFTPAFLLALYLLLGFGADVIIMFCTFWEASVELYEAHDHANRLKYVYKKAGMPCLATSLTSAASFLANLASVLRALREFGFFIGICIMTTYVFIVVGFGAVLVAKDRLRGRCRCYRTRSSKVQLPSCASCGYFSRNCLDAYIVRLLLPHHARLLAFFVIMVIGCFVWTALAVNVDASMPQMLPDDSNHAKVLEVGPAFSSPSAFGPTIGTRCSTENDNIQHNCILNWCEIGGSSPKHLPGDGIDGNKFCYCQAKPSTSCPYFESVCERPEDWCGHDVVEDFDCDQDGIPDPFCRNAWSKTWGQILSSSGQCEEKRTVNIESCRKVNIETKMVNVDVISDFVGLNSELSHDWLSNAEWQRHLSTISRNFTRSSETPIVSVPSAKLQFHADLLQEHWISGYTSLKSYSRAWATVAIRAQASKIYNATKSKCVIREACYCGTASCQEWRPSCNTGTCRRLPTDVVEVPADLRRLGSTQSLGEVDRGPSQVWNKTPDGHTDHVDVLSTGVLAPRRRLGPFYVNVDLVWGISMPKSKPLMGKRDPKDAWSFISDFSLHRPTVQRHLLAACRKMDSQKMMILEQICWIDTFRNWLHKKRMTFPLRAFEFKPQVLMYLSFDSDRTGTYFKDTVWFNDDDDIKALRFWFNVDVSFSSTPSSEIKKLKEVWDKYVLLLNNDAPVGAGRTWHTSNAWIRAEAETAIVSSTFVTLILSIGCGFFGCFVFLNLDLLLSVFVMLSVIGVTIMLAWFMVVLMTWKVGPIEVLGLIIFVGYSIDYSLHVAHGYRAAAAHVVGHGPDAVASRRKAMVNVLRNLSRSIGGSAATTLTSCFFLFFCVLQIFPKLAAILFIVTTFSMVFAMSVLPSAILVLAKIDVQRCECRSLMAQFVEAVNDLQFPENDDVSRRTATADSGAGNLAIGEATISNVSSPIDARSTECSPSNARLGDGLVSPTTATAMSQARVIDSENGRRQNLEAVASTFLEIPRKQEQSPEGPVEESVLRAKADFSDVLVDGLGGMPIPSSAADSAQNMWGGVSTQNPTEQVFISSPLGRGSRNASKLPSRVELPPPNPRAERILSPVDSKRKVDASLVRSCAGPQSSGLKVQDISPDVKKPTVLDKVFVSATACQGWRSRAQMSRVGPLPGKQDGVSSVRL